MWKDLTMSEVWDILSQDIPEQMKRVFTKPDFPTNRWGKITTKTATEEKHALIRCQSLIKVKSRIVKCKETSELRKRKFYKLQVLTPNPKQ